MGTEADYLESQSDEGAADHLREIEQERYYKSLNNMERRYYDNKRSEVGTTIRCACCGRRLLKKSYQTQFCSNKGKSNCKDKYWNNVSDERRERSHRFSH